MEKTIKNERIINAYKTLDSAKMSQMDVADRITVVKALRPMKKASEDFDSFREDAIKRLRPEDYDTIAEKVNKFSAMSQEEQQAALSEKEYVDALTKNMKFNNTVSDCLREEREKEVKLSFAPVSEAAFGKLMESNPDWTVGVISELEDILCTEGKEG